MNIKQFNELEIALTDLLCSALEGGSNSWYEITHHNKERDEFYHVVPFRITGELWIGDRDNYLKEAVKLTVPDMYKAIALMKYEYPRHWQDFINDNADAETGDVFLQLALFGKIVFG